MTSSDWATRLKRGRWLLRSGAEVARCDPLLTADWSLAVRSVSAAFGWDVAQRVGALVLDVARQDSSIARRFVARLPSELAKVGPSQRALMLEGLEMTLAHYGACERILLVLEAIPEAVRALENDEFLAWCSSLKGLGGDSKQFQAHLNTDTDLGKAYFDEAQRGVGLDTVRASLEHYIQARCGRDLRVEALPASDDAMVFGCDGYRVYLPDRVADFGDERDVVSYRVRAAIACAFVEFGSFDLLDAKEMAASTGRVDEHPLLRLVEIYDLPFAAKRLFEAFERIRVTSLLRGKYPGLDRDFGLWRDGLRRKGFARVENENAIDDLLRALEHLWLGGSSTNQRAVDWYREAQARLKGEASVEATRLFFVEKVDELMGMAAHSANTAGASRISDLAVERQQPAEKQYDGQLARLRQKMRTQGIEASSAELRVVLSGNGGGETESYAEIAAFLESNPPPDGGLVDPSLVDRDVDALRPALQGNALRPNGGALYREWDHEIDAYRRDWVRVVEHPIQGGDSGFAERTRSEHGQHIARLRKTFEALKPQEYQRRRGELHGDELDLDRAVSAWVARRAGELPDERIYTHLRRNVRSVAVAFLVDLSSSTNEPARFGGKRIIDVEKEALMVTAEALEALGDDFAIFGFSGFSREEVAFYTAKEFGERYDARVQARIGGLGFKMENRDGAAIRHAGQKLLSHPATTKVLFLLSDGKPLDCGCPMYKDLYAQEDTRVALQELRVQGIKAFCITVDPKGSDYLSTLYGEGNYTVVDDVERLPRQLPQFYRRFAT